MRELLPLPDTPVIAISLSYGKLTSIFFKLFPEAPINEKWSKVGVLNEGRGINFSPERYLPVKLFLCFIISFNWPENTTSPP